MATAPLPPDLRYLYEQLRTARERIRELERERDEALVRVTRLNAKLRDRRKTSAERATPGV